MGCGVIGSGWVARLRLRGIDVQVFDPSPHAKETLDEVQTNATLAWDDLGLDTNSRGSLTICGSIEEAVSGAFLVQESVPERLEIKHAHACCHLRGVPARLLDRILNLRVQANCSRNRGQTSGAPLRCPSVQPRLSSSTRRNRGRRTDISRHDRRRPSRSTAT